MLALSLTIVHVKYIQYVCVYVCLGFHEKMYVGMMTVHSICLPFRVKTKGETANIYSLCRTVCTVIGQSNIQQVVKQHALRFGLLHGRHRGENNCNLSS